MNQQTQSTWKVFLALFLYLLHGCAGLPKVPPQSLAPVGVLDAGLVEPPITLIGLPDVSFELDQHSVSLSLSSGNGELIVPMRMNERAPFPGVLFNGPAVARVSVEYTGLQERCLIDRQRELGLVAARYVADVNTLQLAIQARERANLVLMSSRTDEITRLQSIVETQRRQANGPHIAEGLIWAGGGLLLGVLVAGGIALGVSAN